MPRITITAAGFAPQPYRFPLDTDKVTIGRGPENDIIIDSGSVSSKHAEMMRVPGGFELRDSGSTNGIKLGEERKMMIPLPDGTEAFIGDVSFHISFSPEETTALAAEVSARPVLPSVTPNRVDLPQNSTPPRPAPVAAYPASSGGFGLGTIIVFLILAAAAFFAGLAVRHQKETGGSLIDALQGKPAAAAPAGK